MISAQQDYATDSHGQPALRVAILADMLEEGWASMDLVASSLMRGLIDQQDLGIVPTLVRPPLLTLRPPWRRSIPTAQRVVNRFWLYRRALPTTSGADVFHVLDHSYAHLALHLPSERTVVTCHDTDAFASLVAPGNHIAGLPAFLVRRLGAGLRRAAVVVCPSRATATTLIEAGLVSPSAVAVVPNGVDLAPIDNDAVESLTSPLLGPPGAFIDILNVGSTVDRKRIDVLLHVFAAVGRQRPTLRLVRVGGPFTDRQETLAAELGIRSRILVLPPLDRRTLGAVYQRAAVLLAPSDREGFCLPVAEALALGTPVIASDLPVFRETAGDSALLVRVGDRAAWTAALETLLDERVARTVQWAERRCRAQARGATFSWARYAHDMAVIYRRLAGSARVRGDSFS